MSQFSFELEPQNLMPKRQVWKVSELTAQVRDLLEGKFPDVWVEGEVSNFHTAQSGHLYFTLKDAKSQLRCVCFRDQLRGLKFRPEDGLLVTARGSISVYEVRGEYQLYATQIEPVGLGALQLAFEQMKKRLEAEGLFAAERKKPLPVLPRRIGVVTSPTGAAVRDIVRVLKRRFPNVHVQIYPVRVQGEGAAREIVAALKYFNRAAFVDVLILARGGGSLEDLWAFNEEIVAHAIANSAIPIITGNWPRNGFHDRGFRGGSARADAFGGGGNRGADAAGIRTARCGNGAARRTARALFATGLAAPRARFGVSSRVPTARAVGAATAAAGG